MRSPTTSWCRRRIVARGTIGVAGRDIAHHRVRLRTTTNRMVARTVVVPPTAWCTAVSPTPISPAVDRGVSPTVYALSNTHTLIITMTGTDAVAKWQIADLSIVSTATLTSASSWRGWRGSAVAVVATTTSVSAKAWLALTRDAFSLETLTISPLVQQLLTESYKGA